VSLHTAYSVAAAFVEYVAPAAYDVPPHADPAAGCVVHHPPKLYPDLVNDPEFDANVRSTACVLVWPAGTEPPPLVLPSYDTAYVSAVHTAYNVAAAFAEYVAPAAYDVPPHADPAAGCVVHHPPKLYPDLVNDPEFDANVRSTACVLVWPAGTEPPPLVLPSYDTAYVSTVHCA